MITLDNYKNYQLFSQGKSKPEQVERKMNQLFKRKAILDQNFNEKIVKHNEGGTMKSLFNSHSIEKIMTKQDYTLPPLNDSLLEDPNEDYSIEYMLSCKRVANNDSVQIATSHLQRSISIEQQKGGEGDRSLLDNNIRIHKMIKSLLTYSSRKAETHFDTADRRHQQEDFEKKNSVE